MSTQALHTLLTASTITSEIDTAFIHTIREDIILKAFEIILQNEENNLLWQSEEN